MHPEQMKRLHTQLREALGPAVCAALDDPTVTEIKVSGVNNLLWITKHVVGNVNTGTLVPEADIVLALNLIASLLRKTINEYEPDLSGELPLTGDRVSGSVPPSSKPSLYIRKHAPEIFSLADYVVKGILKPWQVEVLTAHVLQGSNIVVAGGTYSGKTTLLNALLSLIPPNEHVVIIEDTKELQCNAANISRFQTNERSDMLKLIKESLRRKPERLIIGETRDQAGFALLKSWSTGHRGGMTTVHADRARGVFGRFAQFCEEAGVAGNQWRLMRAVIDLIVVIEMFPDGQRRVTQIMEVDKEDTTDIIPIELTALGPPLAMYEP